MAPRGWPKIIPPTPPSPHSGTRTRTSALENNSPHFAALLHSAQQSQTTINGYGPNHPAARRRRPHRPDAPEPAPAPEPPAAPKTQGYVPPHMRGGGKGGGGSGGASLRCPRVSPRCPRVSPRSPRVSSRRVVLQCTGSVLKAAGQSLLRSLLQL